MFSDELVKENPEAKSGYESNSSYLNKSGGKYAKNIANPVNYSFIFVIAIFFGALLSNITKGPQATADDKVAPKTWIARFGSDPGKRYLVAFFGGLLVLFGARLAGGCTSGHMMSGMMQTSLSGFLFAVGAFGAAVPVAIMIFGRRNLGE